MKDLLATVLTSRLSHHATSLAPGANSDAAILSFHEAFIVAAAIAVVGGVVAFFISDKEAAVSMQRAEITIEESEESASAIPVPAH